MNKEKEGNCRVHCPEDISEQTRTVLGRKKGKGASGRHFFSVFFKLGRFNTTVGNRYISLKSRAIPQSQGVSRCKPPAPVRFGLGSY